MKQLVIGERMQRSTLNTQHSTLILLATFCLTSAAIGASSQPAAAPDAAFAESANGRAESIIKGLNIDDAAKTDRAQAALAKFLIDMHEWHATNDQNIKQLSKDPNSAAEVTKLQDQRHAIHDTAIQALSAELTPDQLDKVKEKLTGGQMTATVRNYPEIVPNLTDEDKAIIAKTLLEGREEAMDAANKNDRIAIFKKYKGRINNYLDAHGHNVKQAYTDWGAAQKKKAAGATSKPAAEEGGDAN
jgi:hypothetical protein